MKEGRKPEYPEKTPGGKLFCIVVVRGVFCFYKLPRWSCG